MRSGAVLDSEGDTVGRHEGRIVTNVSSHYLYRILALGRRIFVNPVTFCIRGTGKSPNHAGGGHSSGYPETVVAAALRRGLGEGRSTAPPLATNGSHYADWL